MTGHVQERFDAQDVVIALCVAVLAQAGFLAAFSLPSPKLVEVDISNANAQPIAVAITPVLHLGSKTHSLPASWRRRSPPPPPKTEAPLPSPFAAKNPDAIPTSRVPDASAPTPLQIDAGPAPMVPASADAAVASMSTPAEGSQQGAQNGTATDELRGRAVDIYRAQLVAWFAARFHIRGKIPFDKLKILHAHATVIITSGRTVSSFTLNEPSGDPTFDAEVRATLSRIQSSGIELPAPPPMYPDILGGNLPVDFRCSIKRLCE